MPLTDREELELLELEEREKGAKAPPDAGLTLPNIMAGIEGAASGVERFVPALNPSIPTRARVVPPLVGSVLAPAVGGAVGGGVGETGAQAWEMLSGKRDNFSPGAVGAATLQNAVPIGRFGGPIRNALINAGIQGTTAEVASLLRNGELSIPAGVVGAVGGAFGPAIGTALESGTRAVDALMRRGMNWRQAAAEALRPPALSVLQQQGQAGRQAIEDATGIRPPLSLSESINAPRLTREMNLEGAPLTPEQQAANPMQLANPEFTPEDMARITRVVSKEAADAQHTGIGPNEVARRTFDALQSEGVRVSEPVIQEVNRMAGITAAPAEHPLTQFFNGARRSLATIGSDISDLVGRVHGSASQEWNQAYDAARSLPEYAAARVDANPIFQTAQRLGMEISPNSARTGFLVVAAPAGARTAIQSAGDVPAVLSLDQARGIATELSRNIRNAGVLPGVDTRYRAELLDSVRQQIADAVRPFPALEGALGRANTMYAENIGRFRNAFARGMLSDVGEQRGTIPEAVIRRVTGNDSETHLNELLRITGLRGTAGADASPEALNLVREAILSQAGTAGRAGGLEGLTRSIEAMESVPESVQQRLFPQLPQMRAQQAQLQDQLSRLGNDQLATRDSFDIYRFVSDPRNTSRVSGVMRSVQRTDPALAQDVRGIFMDRLLHQAGDDPAALANLIAEPSASALSRGAGTAGGSAAENAAAVLGDPALRDLRRVVSGLRSIPSPASISDKEQRGFWNWLIFGNTGAGAANSINKIKPAFLRIVNASPAIRYRLASYILTDDTLRRQAMNPTGDSAQRALNTALGMVIQDSAAQAGR